VGITAGTNATRRSPGNVSRGTPTIMNAPPCPSTLFHLTKHQQLSDEDTHKSATAPEGNYKFISHIDDGRGRTTGPDLTPAIRAKEH
jgi:hypothetical protein